MTPAARKLIALMLLDVRRLMRALEAGRLEVQAWQQQFSDYLARYHTAELLVGQRRRDLSDASRRYLGKTVEAQLRFLNNFATEIQEAAEFKAGWNARAALYANGIGQSFWKGHTKFLPLPAMPRDGTCVVTPHSRVLTRRGLVPIADVVVGDQVWTHMHRWRPIVAVHHNAAEQRRLAFVRGNDGQLVGFTSDHRLYSQYGWVPIDYIDSMGLSVYTTPTVKGDSNGTIDMPDMRWAEGSSGDRMPLMRHGAQGAGAMGRSADPDENGAQHPRGQSPAASHVRRYQRCDELAVQEGWARLRPLLGGRLQEVHLPVSMALALCERTDTGGVRYPPQESRSGRRSIREPGVYSTVSTQSYPHTRDTAGDVEGSRRRADSRWAADMRAVRSGIRYPNTSQVESILLSGVLPRIDAPAFDMGMPAVRYDIPGTYGTWARPEILFAGMLDDGTTLYDLEVADDHSFVIEGIVAHNSQCLGNCTCAWEIIELDGEGNYDCHWKLGATERHCQTCPQRAADWAPIKIRDGRLQ